MCPDLPDYEKKVVLVYEGTITGGEVLADHRKILGTSLKSPTVAQSLPVSWEGPYLAYEVCDDAFKVKLVDWAGGTLPVDIAADTLGGLKIVEKNATGLKVDLVTDTLAGLKIIEKLAAGVKVDLTTDTLAGLKVLEKNATGVKFDLVTDTLGGLKVVEKNATGVKFDLVTDTLGGLKVVEKNATGMKVDLVTDTLAGLKVVEKNATGIKVDLVTDTLGGVKVTQATRTSLKVQPEREDLTSLGGTASPNNAGVQLVAPNGTKKVKVYDAGFCGAVDGTHYFYFGTDTNATTKRFCTINKLGVIHQTFVQPRVSAASDGLYLFSSVSETNMPYDVGYVIEA